MCDYINIAAMQRENVLGKSHSFLIAHIVNYIERDGVDELENQGMPFFSLTLTTKSLKFSCQIKTQ